MHIMEGYLPPLHAAAWTAAAAPFVVAGALKVVRVVKAHPEAKMLLAASGAFTFVLSALKMPSVTGSCSHPTGAGLGTVLFGPAVMTFMCSIVLLFQALLLAHGGLTTLGANIFSMGIAGPWVGWLVWRALRGVNAPLEVCVFAAAALADLATYCVTAMQLAVAFPDPATGIAGAAVKFLGVFALTQVPLALVEGLLTVAIMNRLMRFNAGDLRSLAVIR